MEETKLPTKEIIEFMLCMTLVSLSKEIHVLEDVYKTNNNYMVKEEIEHTKQNVEKLKIYYKHLKEHETDSRKYPEAAVKLGMILSCSKKSYEKYHNLLEEAKLQKLRRNQK